MSLRQIQITNLRNLNSIDLELGSKFNLLYGNNGSGKTSFLEAIHYLGLARSFRTHLNSRIINNECDNFSLFGLVEQNGLQVPIGIQREKQKNAGEIRIFGKIAESSVELAEILPLQFMNAEAHRLLLGGPKYRRQFLDWGVFHAEPTFMSAWGRAYRALKQRNAGLRSHILLEELKLWEGELILAAQELDLLRAKYIAEFAPIFQEILCKLLDLVPIVLNYYRGWPIDEELGSALARSWHRDKETGFSQFGPQRADIILRSEGVPIQDRLSQGQQKVAVYALRLAQGILLARQTGKRCIYLIDDLPAELDAYKQKRVAEILMSLDTQVFITGINRVELEPLFPAEHCKLFHVEQGIIKSAWVPRGTY